MAEVVVAMAEPLAHPRRKRLYDVVASKPGLCFRALVAASGIPAGTARHHVSVLMRHGLVDLEQVAAFRHAYFLPSLSQDERRRAVLARSALGPVFDAIRPVLPAVQRELLALLDGSRSTRQHRLDRLVELGYLSKRRRGRYVVYDVATKPEGPRCAVCHNAVR